MKYERLEAEVIRFESVDVIITSGDPIVTPVGGGQTSPQQSSGLF